MMSAASAPELDGSKVFRRFVIENHMKSKMKVWGNEQQGPQNPFTETACDTVMQ